MVNSRSDFTTGKMPPVPTARIWMYQSTGPDVVKRRKHSSPTGNQTPVFQPMKNFYSLIKYCLEIGHDSFF
jgi:hypothetical protein